MLHSVRIAHDKFVCEIEPERVIAGAPLPFRPIPNAGELPLTTVVTAVPQREGGAPVLGLGEVLVATLKGMTVDEFKAEVTKWIATAKHPRWDRLYTELTYQPILEVTRYLRANGYKFV